MKKLLVAAILGFAAVTSVKAQSTVLLYNYGTAGVVNYGSGLEGTAGTGVTAGYTVGLYYVVGNIAASVNTFTGGATTGAPGLNNGTMVGSGLTLATGSGATVALGADGPGIYDSIPQYVIDPLAAANQTVTLVIVAYNGSSYENSTQRGHSAAFTMTANASPVAGLKTGDFSGPFSVALVPEPSTFALAGLGLASLLIFRRRK